MSPPRGFRDRDHLLTAEGFFFTVIGNVHPKDRVISYLKYVPSLKGKWGKGGDRYSRALPYYTIPSLLDTLKYLKENNPYYVWFSEALNIEISAVPLSLLKRHYKPEERLKEILEHGGRDRLEEALTRLVRLIARRSRVDPSYLGVTGSILIGIHNVEFSDIDLTVYGRVNALKVKEALLKLYEEGGEVRRLAGDKLKMLVERRMKLYHLSKGEAEAICRRRWNRGVFEGKDFSMHPVKVEEEVKERYGEQVFKPLKIVTVKGVVADASDAMFMPSTYQLDEVESLEGGWVPKRLTITSYEGLYADIAREGENVKARGKLEKVLNKGGRVEGYRLLIGSPEAGGYDYLVVEEA